MLLRSGSIVVFLLGVLLSFPLYAAKGDECVKSKKLAKMSFDDLVLEGNQYYKDREMVCAAQFYGAAFGKRTDNFFVSYRLARTHWYIGNLDSAINYYNHAFTLDASKNDTLMFDLALALKKKGQYNDAKAMFKKFLDKYPVKDDIYRLQAKMEMEGCDYAGVLKKKFDELPEYRVVPTEGLNEANNDYAPRLFAVKSDSFIIFTTHRPGNRGKKQSYFFTKEEFSDLWMAKIEQDSVFGKPENLGKKVNTKANDGSGVIDPTGQFLYYTICGGGKYEKFHGCSIYQSEYDADAKTWGKPQKVEGINSTREVEVNSRGKKKKVPTYDAQPFLSPDGQTMYFISDRDGGEGETDIYYAQKAGEGWSTPVNVGKTINTKFQEWYPALGQDGKTIYFSSNGHKQGLGGMDLYKSEGKGSNWSEPQNLGYPINTSYDDFAIHWIKQDSAGLITSDRPGAVARDDIWRIVKIPYEKCDLTVHGTVRDRDTKQAIPFATVILFKIKKSEAGNDSTLIPTDTFKTAQNGYYEFTLEKGSRYKALANAPEYLANEEFFSTEGIKCKGGKPMDANGNPWAGEVDVDIILDRIILDRPYVLQNIYYDFDKWDLRPESIATLDKLIKLMNDNPTIVIQIGSHTDTNGSERYNINLAQKRARSVVDFLKKAGVDANRLYFFGFGESEPLIYPEMSDQDEQANRRSEFRIRAMDYDPNKKPEPKKDKGKKGR